MNTQLDTFETALLAELRDQVERRAHRRRSRGVGAVGLAAAVLVVVGAANLLAAPAYAVELRDDGEVVVTIHSLEDAESLEAALADHGIDADVDYGRMPAGAGENPLTPDSDGVPGGGGTLWQLEVDPAPGAEVEVNAADCGFTDDGPMPATLTHQGDDWVLSIPATSPLLERPVYIGTFEGGDLSVQYDSLDPRITCGVVTVS